MASIPTNCKTTWAVGDRFRTSFGRKTGTVLELVENHKSTNASGLHLLVKMDESGVEQLIPSIGIGKLLPGF